MNVTKNVKLAAVVFAAGVGISLFFILLHVVFLIGKIVP
jgi:hypothetical protein